MAFLQSITKKRLLKLSFKALVIFSLIVWSHKSFALFDNITGDTSLLQSMATTLNWGIIPNRLSAGIYYQATSTESFDTVDMVNFIDTNESENPTDNVELRIYDTLSNLNINTLLYTSTSIPASSVPHCDGSTPANTPMTCGVMEFPFGSLITLNSGTNYIFAVFRSSGVQTYPDAYAQGVKISYPYPPTILVSNNGTHFCNDGCVGASYNAGFLRFHYTLAPPVDTTTRLIDFTPAEGATVSNPVNFTLHAYVNHSDVGGTIKLEFLLHNIDQNVLFLGALSASDIYLLKNVVATTSGDFYFSTTTTIGEGNYRLHAILKQTLFSFPYHGIADLSHQFIVGAGTFIGNLSQNGYREMQAIFASSTATSTSALAGTCNPIGGSFDIIKCGTFLLLPGGPELDETVNALYNGILLKAPWGYLTRLYSIFSNSATTSLPAFNVHIVTGPGDNSNTGTSTLSFDMGDMIAGGGAILESIKDPVSGKSARDIFEPFVQLSIGLAVIFQIISDLVGSHKHANAHNSI